MNFRIGQVPVKVAGSFFLIAVILAQGRWSEPALLIEWVLVVLASVLLHEMGHAAAFIRYGHKPEISLYTMGGVTRGSPGTPLSPAQNAVVSFAGPLAGFVAGTLVLLIVKTGGWPQTTFMRRLANDLLYVNIGWGLVNLLPVLPLDGGQLFRSLLAIKWPRRAEKVALSVSLAFCAILLVVALFWRMVWGGLLLASFAYANYQRWRYLSARGDDVSLSERIGEGYRLLAQRQAAAAQEIAQAVLAQARMPVVRNEALHLLAWTHAAEGKLDEAMAIVERMPANEVDAELRGAILRARGDVAQAVGPLRETFARRADTQTATALIEALLASNQLEEAFKLSQTSQGRLLTDQSLMQISSLLYEQARYADALDVSEHRFERFATPDAAYNAACCETKLGHLDRAFGWLKKSVAAGFSDIAHLEQDDDMAPLRAFAGYLEQREKMMANASGR